MTQEGGKGCMYVCVCVRERKRERERERERVPEKPKTRFIVPITQQFN